jgi:hypothetical protein
LIIDNTGALVTVDAGAAVGILEINNLDTDVFVQIHNMAFVNGVADNGGVMWSGEEHAS